MSAADSSAPEPASPVGATRRKHAMSPLNVGRRIKFLLFAALYLIVVIYVSIAPFHYVPLDLTQAWRDLLSVTFSRYDYAEQRADLMGNVFVPVPLAFAFAAIFWRESSLVSRWLGCVLALVISFFLIVAIISAILGFGAIAGVALGFAKVLFFVFMVLFIVMLLMSIFGKATAEDMPKRM